MRIFWLMPAYYLWRVLRTALSMYGKRFKPFSCLSLQATRLVTSRRMSERRTSILLTVPLASPLKLEGSVTGLGLGNQVTEKAKTLGDIKF